MGHWATGIANESGRRWPPAALHARGPVDEAAVRVVSHVAAGLHHLLGPRCDDRFGILMYHRIAENVPGLPAPTINVTPGQFRRQITGLLARGFVFWPLRKVLQFHQRGWSVFPWVSVITFDDGFGGVYRYAWPILTELRIPATVFLCTAYLDSDQPFPFDHWAREHGPRAPAESYRPLTTEQCREMSREGLVELGAHTHSHQDFRGRAAEFGADLATNLDALAERFQVRQPSFAFPYGTPSMGFSGAELVESAQRAGVGCGLTTESALIGRETSTFAWGRIHVFPWDNGATLAAKLGGWYSWAPQLKHWLHAWAAPREANGRAIRHLAPRGRNGRPASGRPLISVVVPTLNRAEWLGEALQSLIAQQTADRFDFEIVVVDNASTDGTRQLVEGIAAGAPVRITYCRQEQPGDAPTRNRGLRAARGQWLAFFDDDQLAEPGWLLALLDAADQTGASIVGGAVHLDLEAERLRQLGPICRRMLRETRLYAHVRPYARRHLPGTGNALVARSVFEAIGAFDESLSQGGSDCDFFARAREQGWTLVYSPRAVIRHRIAAARMSPSSLRRDALSGGAEHAGYFDYQKRGTAALLVLCVMRIAAALLVHLPLFAVAWLRRDSGGMLGRRTRLWRIEGYARRTLAILAPRRFAQREFFASLQLRNGRPDAHSDPSTRVNT